MHNGIDKTGSFITKGQEEKVEVKGCGVVGL